MTVLDYEETLTHETSPDLSRANPFPPDALVTQALYPILMIAGIFRTTLLRVWSGVVVEFRRLPNEDSTDGGVISRSITGWRQNKSLFSWADKGRWHTVETSDEGLRRERNWFRIGFEPTFVDFTQSGTWFTVMFLLEVTSVVPAGLFLPKICRCFVYQRGLFHPLVNLLPLSIVFGLHKTARGKIRMH